MDTLQQIWQLAGLTKTFLFKREFDAGTHHRRRSERGRLFAGMVVVQIRIVNSGEVRLCYIHTPPLFRGLGHATDCLVWLCEMADAYEIQISLHPAQMDINKNALDAIRLTAWYQKHGFVRLGVDYEMVRYPIVL